MFKLPKAIRQPTSHNQSVLSVNAYTVLHFLASALESCSDNSSTYRKSQYDESH